QEHSLRGRVTEFETSEFDVMVVFKSPGYAADVFINRDDGRYTVTTITSGVVSIMNDLHKGRDSGPGWSILIDASAVILMLFSISGFALLLYLKRRRLNGIVVATLGTIAMIAVWGIWVH
ncbi:MAG: PepSY-associated TM helix domain-containing protein, partial [Planctomycetota bacterium]